MSWTCRGHVVVEELGGRLAEPLVLVDALLVDGVAYDTQDARGSKRSREGWTHASQRGVWPQQLTR